MILDDKKIKDILLDEDYITKEDVKNAEKYIKSYRSTFIEYLLTEGIITHDLLGKAIAEYYKVSYVDLKAQPPAKEMVVKIPEDIAKKYRMVLVTLTKDEATVATDNPTQSGIPEVSSEVLGIKKVKVDFAMPEDIEEAFVYYKKPLETRFSKIIAEQGRVAPEIIEEIIEDALAFHASDIHFEPQETQVIIRFRIDGVLHEAGIIPIKYYENILNRAKVLARIPTDTHFAAEDGAIRYVKENIKIDMRVSVMPVMDGEKIAIRMLSEYVAGYSLADLGLSPRHEEMLKQAAKKPFGMIIVAGPTGSGKTTTLYAVLRTLNNTEVNITTIEDPVEYRIAGINQIQVNSETNLTFAKGLKSIARQDPDIILVGEIRDPETSEIAVNAALTGHLLFSTFHANDSATAIPRLLDMNIEPFLLASTLEVILAQRLVRKVCHTCRYSKKVKIKDIEKILPSAKNYFKEEEVTLYEGKGCKTCNNTGYSGRSAIFEFIQATSAMKELIQKNPSTSEIWQLAKEEGAVTLFEDGIEKVKNGITTLEEIIRVAPPK